jgi:hypothetical protein
VGRSADYEPGIVMDALDWSTDSVLDRIERDLDGR